MYASHDMINEKKIHIEKQNNQAKRKIHDDLREKEKQTNKRCLANKHENII